MRKCSIVQHVESDNEHSTKGLKEGGTTRICKAVKYNDLHLPLHSVYLSKQRLYRLRRKILIISGVYMLRRQIESYLALIVL